VWQSVPGGAQPSDLPLRRALMLDGLARGAGFSKGG